MPLLENLAEGVANAAGATNTANAIEKNKTHRQALSDEALEDTVQAHMDTMKGIQAKLGQNPNDPELQKALSGERDQLFQLLHPQNNPGNMGRVQKLFRHVFRQKDPAQPVNNLPSVASMTAAAPGQPDKFKDFQRIYKEATGQDLTPEQSKAWAERQGGIPEPKETATKFQPQLTETTDNEGNKHYWRVPLEAGGNPEEVDFKGQAVTRKGNAGKPMRGWTKKNGKFVSVLLDPKTNQPLPGTENPNIAPPGYLTGRITTGNYHWVDKDNKVHSTQETHTSMPAAGGGGDQSSSKPAGQQKKDVQGMASKSGDRILGQSNKRTTAQNKADNDVLEATKLSSIADQVATKPNDAINQKRLAVALERASAGRFTTQALDYIIKAGWGNTVEQWASNPSTGALPQDVMRQLIDGAHQNLKAAQDA